MEYANIYYFKSINQIGGIEQFFYELSKKYKDRDITIVYQRADAKQLSRLAKNFRCIKFEGQRIECEKAFFNFNTDIIDNVIAKEYCLVVHGNYKWLKGTPPTHPKINKYYAVSKDSAEAFTELTGMPCEVVYNPLNIEKPKKLVKLVSACRLGDAIKGGKRTLELIKELDEFAERNNINYRWDIFSDMVPNIESKNVCIMKPRIDILPYMADADYVVQLSDNFEGYCYTVNEALTLGIPVVITPCNVYEELGIDDTMSIRLSFNMENIDEVVEQILKKNGKFNFKYERPEDRWGDIFVNKKSTYEEEKKMKVTVRCIVPYDDCEFGTHIEPGEEYIVTRERAEILCGGNQYGIKFAEIIEEVKEEPVEKIKEEPKKEPAKKKTTKKK